MHRSLLVPDPGSLAAPPAPPPARVGDRPEAPGLAAALAWDDPENELRAALEACAVLDATDRGAVVVRGPEAADFLHRLLANGVKDLAPGAWNANLLLTGKGKVRFVFELVREAPDAFRLETPPGTAAALSEALDAYHFTEKVELADASEETAPLELVGPAARSVLEAAVGAAPADGERLRAEWRGRALTLTGLPVAGRPGVRADAGPGAALALREALDAAGATMAGIEARERLRVSARAPLAGLDVDETVYPQEARLDARFRLDKGCYVGQEVVAKIDTYGGLNRRLELLRLGDGTPLEKGTPLFLPDDEERAVGVLSSWVRDGSGGALALGYVKLALAKPGTMLRAGPGGPEATVVEP